MNLRDAMLASGGLHTEYKEPNRTVHTYINVDIEMAERLFLNALPAPSAKKSWVPEWLWKPLIKKGRYRELH